MELKDKDVIKRGIMVNSPSSDYEPTIGLVAEKYFAIPIQSEKQN